MLEVFLNFLGPILVVLFGSGGALAAWLKARHDKKAGVREADVVEKRDSSDLALRLAEQLAKDRDKDRARLDHIERENIHLVATLDHFRFVIGEVVHMLTELVAWEQEGSPPPPPHRLSHILAQLTRLTRTHVTRDNTKE